MPIAYKVCLKHTGIQVTFCEIPWLFRSTRESASIQQMRCDWIDFSLLKVCSPNYKTFEQRTNSANDLDTRLPPRASFQVYNL